MTDYVRQITKGVAGTVPEYLRNVLWYMFEISEDAKKDGLHAFFLEDGGLDGRVKQKITHILARPSSRQEYLVTVNKTVWAKIYVKSFCGCSTMFLEEEL